MLEISKCPVCLEVLSKNKVKGLSIHVMYEVMNNKRETEKKLRIKGISQILIKLERKIETRKSTLEKLERSIRKKEFLLKKVDSEIEGKTQRLIDVKKKYWKYA